MDFGNWKVTQNSITWKGKGMQPFEIHEDKLTATRKTNTDEIRIYESIVLATNEDWLTENDLFDLNFAFVYAVAKFGLHFNYDIFDATLAYQFEIFEAEDEEG